MKRWLLLLFVGTAWADIDPGNWEITASTEVPGAQEPASFKQTRCLTPADARDPNRLFGSVPGAGCQFLTRSDTGSVFAFEIACDLPQPVRGAGSVRYGRESLDGEMEIRIEGFVTRSRITGRRIGAC